MSGSGPRYWQFETARLAAKERAQRTGRTYYVFGNDVDGSWSVSAYSDSGGEGSVMRLVDVVQP